MSFGAFLPEASDSQCFAFCLIFAEIPIILMHYVPLLYITYSPCTLYHAPYFTKFSPLLFKRKLTSGFFLSRTTMLSIKPL